MSTELTPKRYKITQLVGVLLLLLGVIIRAGTGEYYGMWFVVLGVLLYAVGRIGAWLARG